MMRTRYILPLADPSATLENVGGKGVSLARLCQAGLPVPGGFHVTTSAYRHFVEANRLQPEILAAVAQADINRPDTLETAARRINSLFDRSAIPAEIEASVMEAYADLPGKNPSLAVRSSATAEDLPETSFAGQQETYLNIQGPDAVMEAVKKCWASLWTARAIAYRLKNQVDQNSVTLAVVVQELVFADAAGILFTANPLNGRRGEALINAAWGLGEAVVSGAVTPDTLTMQKSDGKFLRRQVSVKEVMTVRTESGTREAPTPANLKKKAVLSRDQAVELVRLGIQIEQMYGFPVDVEWALAGGSFAILQARPITGLGPDWTPPKPRVMYARGSLAEHLPNPVTPLFGTLGIRAVNRATLEMESWMNLDLAGMEYQYRVINGYVYMGFLLSLKSTLDMFKIAFKSLGMMLFQGVTRWREARQELLKVLAAWEDRPLDEMRAVELLAAAEEVFTGLGRLYTVLQSGTLPGSTSSEMVFGRVLGMVRRKGEPDASAFVFGFDTVPMQAEKSLFDLAAWVKTRPGLAEVILNTPTQALAERLEETSKVSETFEVLPGEDWAELRDRFAAHLRAYGATVYDLDFANPTPVETPGPLIDALKMYLKGQGHDPHERQRAAVELRRQAEQRILARLKWPLKGWFIKSLKWAQDMGPAREDSLFDLGLANPLVRRMMGEVGRRAAAGGAIADREDIYWLEEPVVAQLAARLDGGEALPDLRATVAANKAAWQAQLKLTPPAMLPEHSSIARMIPWHKTDQTGSLLTGYPASPGSVTAPACVLASPADFSRMKPGSVLVAVTTTPAWTPLFAMAAAVVTDIGGPLSHSSIVAREYGIPAVMAAGLATRRIKDGQMIRVDGAAGTVELL